MKAVQSRLHTTTSGGERGGKESPRECFYLLREMRVCVRVRVRARVCACVLGVFFYSPKYCLFLLVPALNVLAPCLLAKYYLFLLVPALNVLAPCFLFFF